MAATQSLVLVTGGNNGIGYETCLTLSTDPRFHVVMGSRSLSKGESALDRIRASHPTASLSLIQFDINSDSSIAAAASQIATQWGKLDVLINNAGICPTTSSRQLLRDTLETNAISPACVTEAFAPLLRKSSPGARVIYVSSLLGSVTTRSDPKAQARDEDYKAYRVSKAALNMLAACDSWQYHADGIKVFAYCPGFVVTDLADMREAKTAMGAPTPEVSARGLLDIASGRRDGEAGLFLNNRNGENGVFPW